MEFFEERNGKGWFKWIYEAISDLSHDKVASGAAPCLKSN
jgi:hypothetical protein